MSFNFGQALTVVEAAFALLPKAKDMVIQAEQLIPSGQGGGATKLALVEEGIMALIAAESTIAPLAKQIWTAMTPLVNLIVSWIKQPSPQPVVLGAAAAPTQVTGVTQ